MFGRRRRVTWTARWSLRGSWPSGAAAATGTSLATPAGSTWRRKPFAANQLQLSIISTSYQHISTMQVSHEASHRPELHSRQSLHRMCNASGVAGAQQMCWRLGGWLHYPNDTKTFLKEDQKLFKVLQPLSHKKKPNPRCGKRLWLGIDDLEQEDNWVVKKTGLPWPNWQEYFQPGQPNGARRQNVAGFHFGTR